MKILIISHNATSNINNMGKTIKSLFSSFEKDDLCQLYIYPSIPDADVCSSYYRITDKSVLKSYFSSKLPGEEIFMSQCSGNGKNSILEDEKDASIYGKKSNQRAFKRVLRDLMWRFSHWYNKNLREWLNREKPRCIFLAPGYAKFIYDIALKISEEMNIPIVSYICDDYYFVKSPKSVVGKLQLGLLRRKIDETMNKTSHLVVICEELREIYSEKFSVPTSVVMTGADIKKSVERDWSNVEIRKLSYFGNLSCNRYVSLGEIGEALKEINKATGTDFELNIYSNEKDERILNQLRDIETINLCGFVTGEQYENAFFSSDMLVHVEAFDEESIDLVKYSVSTKIADCLASGIPMLVYGPEMVASIKYLKRNNAAIVANRREDLFLMLEKTVANYYNEAKIENALNLAAENHNKEKSSKKIRKILGDLIND